VRQRLPILFLRIVLGLYFLCGGLLVFLTPAQMGDARFAAAGLPMPHLLATAGGSLELLGGIFLLINFYAGDAALLLALTVLAQCISLRVPVLLGQPWGALKPPALEAYGWLPFLHQARTDLLLLVALVGITIDAGLILGRKRRWYQEP